MMTNEEIYKLYRKTEYDSPKLLKVLADVCSITVETLKQIIKDGDENSMPKGTRWTDEQHAIYDRMTAENAKAADIAEAMGVPVKAVHSRKSNDKAKLNSIHEPKGKPATINKEVDDFLPAPAKPEVNKQIADLCETPDPEPKPDYTESLLETLREANEDKDYTIKVREKSILMIDAGFSKYMELSKSLIETLREESESDRAHYVKLNEILSEQEKDLAETHDTIFRQKKMIDDYQRKEESKQLKTNVRIGMDSSDAADAFAFATLALHDLHKSLGKAKSKPPASIFDRAHDIITLLRHNAEDQDISVESITLTVNKFIVDVSGTNASGECVGWHKKYQPTECKSAD